MQERVPRVRVAAVLLQRRVREPCHVRAVGVLGILQERVPKGVSYAFDDATSTFTCAGGDTAYTVTFCPGSNRYDIACCTSLVSSHQPSVACVVKLNHKKATDPLNIARRQRADEGKNLLAFGLY